MMAGDKNNEHTIVDVIDDVGGLISANGLHLDIKKNSVVTLAAVAVSAHEGFAAVVIVNVHFFRAKIIFDAFDLNIIVIT